MAQQTTVKRPATVPEKPAAAPPKPRAKAAKVFDYAKFRQSIRDEKDFSSYLAGYPNKTGILAYLYRLVPAIDNSLIGIGENSIYKTSNVAEMTRDFIASKFGRGKYMLKLSDANRAKGETEACRTWFFVDDPDLTPIYDPRTLKLGDPENQDEVVRLFNAGVLVRDAATGAPRLKTESDTVQPAAAAGTGANGDLLSRDLVSQVLLKVISAGAQNPGDTMKQAIDIAKMLQPAQTQPQLSVEQIAELVAARLERTVTRTNGDGDFFQTYERVEAFIQKVKGPPPVTVSEGASGWITLAGTLLERLDRWAPAIVQAIQTRQSQPRRVNGHRRQPEAQQTEQAQLSLADRIAQIAQLGFQKMSEGINGFDFAAYVCNYMPGGLEVYQLLEPQGPAGVMGFAAMNPQMAPMMSNPEKRAQVETFLSEFFEYSPDPVPSELPSEAVGAGAAAVA